MRKARQPRVRGLIAGVLAAVLGCGLALAMATHDFVAHSRGNDAHPCPICQVSQGSDVAAPVATDVPPAPVSRVAVPVAELAPAVLAVDYAHIARGPPAARA